MVVMHSIGSECDEESVKVLRVALHPKCCEAMESEDQVRKDPLMGRSMRMEGTTDWMLPAPAINGLELGGTWVGGSCGCNLVIPPANTLPFVSQ